MKYTLFPEILITTINKRKINKRICRIIEIYEVYLWYRNYNIKNIIMSTAEITFRKRGKEDSMGFTWYGAFQGGEKVMKQNQHLSYKAIDASHAKRMYDQFN